MVKQSVTVLKDNRNVSLLCALLVVSGGYPFQFSIFNFSNPFNGSINIPGEYFVVLSVLPLGSNYNSTHLLWEARRQSDDCSPFTTQLCHLTI